MTGGIENQLTPIRDVSHRIAAGAGTLGNLSDLRTSLVEILERRERDPGIEAAAHDVYEGAVAIVESGTPPTHRQQRLLREATQRFEERLTQGGPPAGSDATGSVQSPATEAAQGGFGAGSPGVAAQPGTQGGPSAQTGTK